MEISRKTFLGKLGAGALGLGAMSAAGPLRLFGQTSNPADTERVMKALPLGATEAASPTGNALFVQHGGPGFGRRIAITFDDGPNPKITERVLAALQERNLQASFFMIGQRVAAAPEWARKVAAAGHEICNHSLTHPQLSRLSDERVAYELEKTQDLIAAAVGKKPDWFRPPYGAFKKSQGQIPAALGLGVIWWTVDPRDWSQPGAQKISDIILRETQPGSVILCHDLHPQTADALPGILDGLLERGYEFTTVSGFFGAPYGNIPGALPQGTAPAAPLPPGPPPAGEPAMPIPVSIPVPVPPA